MKLLVALIGIHALYPQQARMLPLGAIDFRRRRLVVAGIDRPLDGFTGQAAADYLRMRHARWPHTRNPYLFVSSQTVYTDASVTFGWMHLLLRGVPATAQQLREDRLLEEAAAGGGDPLHLCALFNIVPETGLRYVRPLWPTPE
ncbi:site-specific integrase [Streptomyces mirabilis]|uniref:hypothetical protein n=1 Tax=Streptomyces mirabilis TaxID=68239 RepID=UPI0036BC5455